MKMHALLAAVAALRLGAAAAACDTPSSHALDFWLGHWSVLADAGELAQSRIERSASGCVIVERYAQADGYSGTSLSFYDAALGRWRQTWVDSTGGVGEFTGSASAGLMEFTGETHRADGSRVQRRMSLAVEGRDVTQRSVASRDGIEWKPHYTLRYVRRAD
jgi:hypothetical protein